MGNKSHAAAKRAWEREAINLLIKLYNEGAEVRRYRLLYQQEKPDAVLEDLKRRSKLGVEITHLFYSQEEAMRTFRVGLPPVERGPEAFDHLLKELNLLIRKKVGKRSSYSMAYPIALLVRNAAPGLGMEDFVARLAEVELPPAGVFHHIWFVSRDNGGTWQLLQLL